MGTRILETVAGTIQSSALALAGGISLLIPTAAVAQIDFALDYIPQGADFIAAGDPSRLGAFEFLTESLHSAASEPIASLLGVPEEVDGKVVTAIVGFQGFLSRLGPITITGESDVLDIQSQFFDVSVSIYELNAEVEGEVTADTISSTGSYTLYRIPETSALGKISQGEGAFYFPKPTILVVGSEDTVSGIASGATPTGPGSNFDFVEKSHAAFFATSFSDQLSMPTGLLSGEVPDYIKSYLENLVPNLRGFGIGIDTSKTNPTLSLQFGLSPDLDADDLEMATESFIQQLGDENRKSLQSNPGAGLLGPIGPMITGMIECFEAEVEASRMTVSTEVPEALVNTLQSFAQNMSSGELMGATQGSQSLPDLLTLSNGTEVRGTITPESINENGIVVQLSTGGFSRRYHWSELSQETLKRLARSDVASESSTPEERSRNIRNLSHAQLYILKERDPRPNFRLIEPDNRVALGNSEGNPFFALFKSQVGLFFIGLIYVANLYTASQVARFKGHNSALVCGCAAIIPIFVPLVFTFIPAEDDEPAYEEEDYEPEEEEDSTPKKGMTTGAPTGLGEPEGDSGGLTLTGGGQSEGASTIADLHLHYKEAPITRAVIERQLAPFFRGVPSPQDKDYVLDIKTARQRYVALRISRISSTDMHVRLQSNSAAETPIKIAELVEIRVRHKDEK